MEGAPRQWEIYAASTTRDGQSRRQRLVPFGNEAGSGGRRREFLWSVCPSRFSGGLILPCRGAANGAASRQNLTLGT